MAKSPALSLNANRDCETSSGLPESNQAPQPELSVNSECSMVTGVHSAMSPPHSLVPREQATVYAKR